MTKKQYKEKCRWKTSILIVHSTLFRCSNKLILQADSKGSNLYQQLPEIQQFRAFVLFFHESDARRDQDEPIVPYVYLHPLTKNQSNQKNILTFRGNLDWK